MSTSQTIDFVLNDKTLSANVSPTLVALDFVRKHCSLTGSKEGCKEGDCGACTVIVGELQDGSLRYRPVTSCLLPMGDLQGKHLVTIEGLNQRLLTPVQAALVECGGTQCGYCTPGFVVAMTAGLMDESIPTDRKGVDYAISGNLCRCTGYRSIKAAGCSVMEGLAEKLGSKPRIEALCQEGILPDYFSGIPERLEKIAASQKPDAVEEKLPPFIAGGTDLFVQRGEELPYQKATLLNTASKIPIHIEDGFIVFDARETFELFARSPIVKKAIPQIAAYSDAVASWPIRERATFGGNICNASPIADYTSLLLALEAELTLTDGNSDRSIALSDFYLGYKQLAKRPEEWISSIRFPLPSENEKVNWEKVSKRRVLDIATVNAAAKIKVENGTIASAALSLGGVAATPLRLIETEKALRGLPLKTESIAPVLESAQSEFSPIGDVRGSASYKRLLARQLLWSHFRKLFPESITEESLHETLR